MWDITPETLDQSDEKLGWELLSRLIFFFADRRGIPVSAVTVDIAKSEFLKLATQDSDNAAIAGLEKAYKRAVRKKDIAGAGRMFRSFLLDLHKSKRNELLAAIGIKFTKGRKRGTGGRIRKAIAKLLKASPTIKNPAIWISLQNTPPRGWQFFNNSIGKYVEGPKARDRMTYGRFCNVCGEERKKARKEKNTG